MAKFVAIALTAAMLVGGYSYAAETVRADDPDQTYIACCRDGGWGGGRRSGGGWGRGRDDGWGRGCGYGNGYRSNDDGYHRDDGRYNGGYRMRGSGCMW